ncbi:MULTISPECIES: fasciclin domain-containing protein [Cyanophyceae]|uniref:Fasciclin domain-containing protein n=1 Tax=Stenomitos frigidus AS-A4 TaxID=2933935 RepID=A0ABV0KLJ2_9CYAN|nr:fasciclin domain-containing protein [Phormidium sp. FACHB-592]
MQKRYRLTMSQTLSILAGVAGLGVAVVAPTIAQTQTTPGAGTAPAGVTQPSPTPTAPGQTVPGQTSPGQPSLGQPSPAPTVPGQTVPGQPSPTPTAPGQPSPGQPSPRPTPTGTRPGSPSQVPAGTTQPTPRQSPASGNPAPRSTRNLTLSTLLQQGAKAGSFKTLARAVEAAGLTQTVQQGGNFTVFAPTDAAFTALPAGTLAKLLKPENKALLRQVLAYHVVPGTVPSSALKTGLVKTLGGGLAVRVDGDKVVVNNASVIQADIAASNGVVHAINRVLISSATKQRLTTLK